MSRHGRVGGRKRPRGRDRGGEGRSGAVAPLWPAQAGGVLRSNPGSEAITPVPATASEVHYRFSEDGVFTVVDGKVVDTVRLRGL